MMRRNKLPGMCPNFIRVRIGCGSEYLDQETLKEIEKEIKERKIFALEKKVRVIRSGESLVIKIPPEFAEKIRCQSRVNCQILVAVLNR
ncbi:MAG TPA: hypothetical protein C5S37_05305 [Methanophagales archaeon]|nr:hypothetical protein [Methanophagales archaeon]